MGIGVTTKARLHFSHVSFTTKRSVLLGESLKNIVGTKNT
jgi:hypothetical protein